MRSPSDDREKSFNVDRVVFFSDAVIAIAITLLVLDLKLDVPDSRLIQWEDLVKLAPKFGAYSLSFFLIALYWVIHNQFFRYIKRVDEPLVWLNIAWLFFLGLLPFSTSLLSAHFGEPVPTVIYTINTLGIAASQNFVWDYAAARPNFIDETLSPSWIRTYRIFFTIGMINGLVAIVFAFFAPTIAFFILFTRPLMMMIYRRWFDKSPFPTQ